MISLAIEVVKDWDIGVGLIIWLVVGCGLEVKTTLPLPCRSTLKDCVIQLMFPSLFGYYFCEYFDFISYVIYFV